MKLQQNIQKHERNIKPYFKLHPTTNILSNYGSFTEHQKVAKTNERHLMYERHGWTVVPAMDAIYSRAETEQLSKPQERSK